MGLILEEFDIGVEEVTLGDVDVLGAELVDELENASGDGSLADGGDVGIRADDNFVFQDDAVEFGDVELVGGGARRDLEGEAVAGEDGACSFQSDGFDGGLDVGE